MSTGVSNIRATSNATFPCPNIIPFSPLRSGLSYITTKDFIEYLNSPNNTYTLIDKPLELYTYYDTSIIKIVSDYCDKIK